MNEEKVAGTNPEMNKEQVYDEILRPLMDQVIGICQQHSIAMIANFAIGTEEVPTLRCGSLIPDQDGDVPSDYFVASQLFGMQG